MQIENSDMALYLMGISLFFSLFLPSFLVWFGCNDNAAFNPTLSLFAFANILQ
jgi:hypothetical protein